MTQFIVHACCSAGIERGRGYVAAADAPPIPGQGFGWSSAPGPPIAEIEHEVEERTCWHESAHGTLGFGFGWHISSISVVPPEAVRWCPGIQREPLLAVVNSLGGPAGEDERVHWYYDEPEPIVADYLDRVRQCEGGTCDQCRASLNIWHMIGVSAPIDAAIARWRQAETKARELLAMPRVRAAVAELADRLFAEHTVAGEAAEAIITKHLEFGSLRAAVEAA